MVDDEGNIYLFNQSHDSTEPQFRYRLPDESGSIKSIEFDEFGNNLYWLSPRDHSIKVYSFKTGEMTVIYDGNSRNHVPLDFTLAPSQKQVKILVFGFSFRLILI